ncbi:G-type lectin S-receptor-like serine/threonine-protein kinase LECRK3 [Ananas comosus]|uniref:Receptor-like serine/threonine-protein kinase n=1 Tax=Ananas comosus TaxID=4615 RepID=A0A6P5GKJ0_ANACO|nr:G-type lectin S-receptor-like serine/threonine-protein kinase LECRK3 [Ananas comosus]
MVMDATNPSLLFLLLLLLLLLDRGLSLVVAGSYQNLTVGSNLSSSGPNSSIFSPSGDFAFGFWPLDTDSSLFLLAVWFNNTSPQVVVWFATNNTNPVQVPAKSTLHLTQAGQLSLFDSNGQEVWSRDAANATGVSLLDSGNLVLYDSSGALPWQSFQNPTDTILPGQSLGENSELRSKLTSSDFSTGRFELAVQSDGNLVLYPIAIPTGNVYRAYWASNTQYDKKLQLVFNSSGSLYYQVENSSQTSLTSAAMYSPTDFYERATLDPDGALRLYVYPKNNNNNSGSTNTWTVVGMLPANPCQKIQADGDGGGGACGFNAYCNFDDDQSMQLNCECVLGCKFIDTNRTYLGCIPDFTVQSCDEYQSNQYMFNEMPNMDWPGNSYEHYTPTDEDTCRALCLADCLCSAAVFQGVDCWKIKMPLTNGGQGMSVGGKALIKVPKTNASFPAHGSLNTITVVKKDRSALILIISVLLGSSGFLNILIVIAAAIVSFSFCNRTKDKKNQMEQTMLGSNLRVFTYKELEEATDNFREELGSGGFGVVYKGALAAEFRTAIAVKKLDRAAAKESEQEFTNEVRSIAQTHHKNLVKLLGFCNEGNHRMLVYEHMSNGSLTSFLFGCTRPEWNKRAQIVLGIARGLLYLHEDCTAQIIHCDIKSQNILLDDNFIPKISDFGLAKLLRADQTRTNTAIRGTKGYVAPEWFKNSAVTAKVDVFSFGVLLLEIVCCRKNVQMEAATEEATVLTYWAYDCFKDGRLDLLVDGDEEAMFDIKRVERFVMVAIWCIQEEPSLRPSMRKVAQMLEGAVAVAVPPDPSSYISSIV